MNATRTTLATALIAVAAFAASIAQAATPAENPPTPAPKHERQSPQVEKHLKKFDTLDFDVFSHQKWDRLHESHAKDIVVTWPDGHETKGLDRHTEDLKAMFVFAPDISIKTHPVRFGSGSWTTATGVMTGTFTRPMPLPDGTSIAPTGQRFAISMATIGHWQRGTMDHEWLFWDNQDFMKQLGLGGK
ncbi:SnoaL-like polyketide cyclase [Sphaerotilus hippei]|uniref:SnoaL-like polyketide cyclase n=1 Tax=Sphaerotilus hippei TaxID=744406 RepID=A0A318H8X4_9BURK|nr:ester cyclase [Sphaerotilus hippei]PXW99358.1 SnoaL-like polyketide cyclase [Sphaerotilus hippei]